MLSQEFDAVYVRELGIDDIAPVYHLGEELFTSDLYPYLYRCWDEWEVIGLYNTDQNTAWLPKLTNNWQDSF